MLGKSCMFTKLTRINGSPVWLNTSFVVAIEPGRQGGSVVVPVGDNLDYEVRESPAEILGLLGDAPTPDLVPVVVADSLAKSLEKKAPEENTIPDANQGVKETKEAPEAPAESVTYSEPKEETGETVAAPKTRARKGTTATKKTTRTRTKAAKKPILDLTEEQVDRLRKMAPGSLKKLQNTLIAQFRVPDVDATTTALVAHDVALTDEHGRILWKPKPQPVTEA